MTFLYTCSQVKELEALIFTEEINTPFGLMEKAGVAAFNEIKKHYPSIKTMSVVCGKGNNGGDGFIIAYLAKLAGIDSTIYTIDEMLTNSETAEMAYQKAFNAGVPVLNFQSNVDFNSDIVVDCLLGTGIKGKLEKSYAECISTINNFDGPVVSIDVPSGINADTGVVLGDAVNACLTVTFLALKRGLFIRNSRDACGEIILADLDTPSPLLRKIEHAAELMTWDDIRKLLPRRRRDAHKGDFGHVLIIGGDYGMGGAVRMAAEACMRVGAGLVTVATRPEHISVVSGMRPEVMCQRCSTPEELEELLTKVTTVVIGPGLGKSDWSKMLIEGVLKSIIPKVLDADALNLLSQSPTARDDWILTPHPGEASRLMQCGTGDVQEDRFEAAQDLQHRYDGVVVLKGSGTIIQGKGRIPYVCAEGNPGMATGGMGDILSGMIGGFLAQGLSLDEAAEVGVFIHSKAADKAAENKGERGLLATDILEYLPELVNPYMQEEF